MYQEVSGQLVWFSQEEPRWKDWRGRMLYRSRVANRRNTNERH